MKKLNKKQIQEAVIKWKGNWKKFDSFAWFERPEDYDNWCIVGTHHRDSTAREKSNGAYFHKHMNPLVDDTKDVIEWGASHWAVGYVDGWAVRVVDADGKPTKAFVKLAHLLAELEEKSILDRQDYDQRMQEGKRENIKYFAEHCLPIGCSLKKDGLPEDWIDQVMGKLTEIDRHWEDDLDPEGVPSPRDDELLEALVQLGWVERDAA